VAGFKVETNEYIEAEVRSSQGPAVRRNRNFDAPQEQYADDTDYEQEKYIFLLTHSVMAALLDLHINAYSSACCVRVLQQKHMRRVSVTGMHSRTATPRQVPPPRLWLVVQQLLRLCYSSLDWLQQESDARQLQRQKLEDQRYKEDKQIDQQRYIYEEHRQFMQSTHVDICTEL